MPDLFEPFLALAAERDRFLVSGHVNPDGDCIGTQVGLYHFLAARGKQVTILNSHRPEPVFDFLERHTPFGVHRDGEPLPEHDVHIITDCSTLERLGSVGKSAAGLDGVVRVVVDHHVGSDRGDGDVLVWDPEACASGALVYDLFRKAGAPMSVPAAEGIFVSIVSDTGWFRYSNTTDEALAICADLVAHGVRPHEVYNAMFRRKPAASIELLSEAMAMARFEHDGRIAVLALPKDYMARVESADFNTDDLIDPLRSVRGVDVVILLKARNDGNVKISLRASDRLDVDGVARSYGGGGHRKAAGAEVSGGLEDVTRRIVASVDELLRT